MYISFTIGLLMTFFCFQVVRILSIFNLATLPLQKLCKMSCAKYVVVITNGNVHCNVCGMKTTIKKANFL